MSAVAKAGAQFGFVSGNAFSALMTSEPLLPLMVLRVLAEVHSTRSAISEPEPPPHGGIALMRKKQKKQLSPQLRSE
jgi:hypothetical protein